MVIKTIEMRDLLSAASLTPAVAPGGVAEVAALADAAVAALGVVEALAAAARLPVAGGRVRHVDVVVAPARLAAPAGPRRVAVETRSTFPTASSWRGGEEARRKRTRNTMRRGRRRRGNGLHVVL